MNKHRILSGMRPTGELHLGHLVGALKNWIDLQSKYECFFMIADWHALMSEYESPAGIKKWTFENILDWLSCGIDPGRSTIFIQSDLSQHLELNMIFSCITPLAWLKRNPTYKEQIKELKEKKLQTHAFLGYPVLQASDILLYKATAVPVGEDQLPHLELTREIVRRFNSLYESVLPEPEAILTPVPRLLGLDGRKMSKSYDNYIALGDSPQVIREKVQSMFTDPERIKVTDPGHPERCNVHNYYEVFASDIAKDIAENCRHAHTGCKDCKKKLSEILVKHLEPIRKRRKELSEQKNKVESILKQGAAEAKKVAEQTLSEVKKAMSLI